MLAEREPGRARPGRTSSSRRSRTCARRSTTATASATTRSTSCSPTSTSPTATCASARARHALRGARAAHAGARALLRQPRRRPPGAWTACAATPTRWPRATSTNELEPAAVDAMMAAIESRYDIAQRWFRHKAELLGHRAAAPRRPVRAARRAAATVPLRGVARRRARRVRALLGRGRAASASAFFDERRVDAEPRAGKRGGAFCASVAQDAQPYIMLNYTDTLRDVMTMAHELGHGMHFALLARRQTRALVPRAARALRGAVDVRRAARLRPHAGDARTTRRRARRSSRAELECGLRDGLPADDDGALRAGRLRARADGKALTPERLSEFWYERERALLRRLDRAAGGLPRRLELHPALHPHALLHVRVRVRAPREPRALRDLPASEGAAFFARATSSSWRPAAPPRRATSSQAFGVDLGETATWDRGLDEMERLLQVALAE